MDDSNSKPSTDNAGLEYDDAFIIEDAKYPSPAAREALRAMCREAVDHGKLGLSRTEIASELGIARRTLYQYRSDFPEFASALELAATHAQAYWERLGRNNMTAGKSFNEGAYKFVMSSRFRGRGEGDQEDDGYVERTDITSDDKPISYVITTAEEQF